MNTESGKLYFVYFVELGLPYDAIVSTHMLRLESLLPIPCEVIKSLTEVGIVGATFQTMQKYRESRHV
jgi:hypothetical protein